MGRLKVLFIVLPHACNFIFLPFEVSWYFYMYWALMVHNFTNVFLLIFFYLPALCGPIIKLSGHIKVSRQKVLPLGLRLIK